MSKLNPVQLDVLVGNVCAKQLVSGKSLNAVQRAVAVRVSNARAIHESCQALRASESR